MQQICQKPANPRACARTLLGFIQAGKVEIEIDPGDTVATNKSSSTDIPFSICVQTSECFKRALATKSDIGAGKTDVQADALGR
jgi:hypothetical protein